MPGNFEIFPLSEGNGSYSIGVYEQVDGTRFAVASTATINVILADEFMPFLTPNQYVNYDKNSQTVKKAFELVRETIGFIDKIAAVYNYVINNFTYDKELARTVQSGYLPDVDAVLRRRKGICFDYAAVMTAMLRSQGIPCQLVVGYAGEIYHAWLNVYSKETGWINKVIFFDGRSWTLMDPTFASNANQSSEIMRFIGDGTNYRVSFRY
jgi:transglutaminase-like putative cysteine protease